VRRHRRGRRLGGVLDAGEGFIDVLFLLLTFFIIQNVWQTHLSDLHNRFVHAQKLDFVKAVAESSSPAKSVPSDERFVQIIIGQAFVQFDKGGLITEAKYVFEYGTDAETVGIERAVFQATKKALESLIALNGISPEDILVRLYFERDARVTYTVGVYDALNQAGFKSVQWGLESQKRRL